MFSLFHCHDSMAERSYSETPGTFLLLSPRCFTILDEHPSFCWTRVPDPSQGSHTCGPRDLKPYQKEHNRKLMAGAKLHLCVHVFMYRCGCVWVYIYPYYEYGIYMCIYIPPYGFRVPLTLFKASRTILDCKKHHGLEQKAWIKGIGFNLGPPH